LPKLLLKPWNKHTDDMRTLVVISLLLSLSANAGAQQLDLFDSEQLRYAGKGWSWGIGWHVLTASPANPSDQWIVANADGGLDTMHVGGWENQGGQALRLGISHWRVFENPVLFDRWCIEVAGTRNKVDAMFTGLVAGSDSSLFLNSLHDHGQSTLTIQTAIQVYRSIELLPDFFLEGHLGVGFDYEINPTFERLGPDSLFIPWERPSDWRVALEGGVGLGVHTQGGRYLRLVLNTDLVQLKPTSIQGGGNIDWMDGSYRPWQISLQWDLLKRKPAASCAGQPEGQPGRDLFGPKMRKKMRWGSKRQ
jgi:hypothetical protein